MLPLSTSVHSQRLPAGAARLSDGQLEALKWLALLLMVLDHTNSYLLGHSQDWMFSVGRMAFPLFAFALGAALAPYGADKYRRAAYRLLPFALVAQVGSQLVRDQAVLNILFVFLAAAAWLAADAEDVAARWGIRICAVITAALCEFGLPGFFFVLSLWRFERGGRWGYGLAALMCLAAVAFFDATPAAFAAAGCVAIVSLLGLSVRRVPHFFAWFYVLQFPLFQAVRWVGG